MHKEIFGRANYLACPHEFNDADCSKAQQVNNASAGCVVQVSLSEGQQRQAIRPL